MKRGERGETARNDHFRHAKCAGVFVDVVTPCYPHPGWLPDRMYMEADLNPVREARPGTAMLNHVYS